MSAPSASWLSRLLRAVLGEFHYQPPDWARRFGGKADDQIQRHPGRWVVAILGIGLLYAGGLQTYKWWEAHQPQTRQLTENREILGTVTPPGVTPIVKGKPQPEAVTLAFSGATAKLEAVGKPAAGVTLQPEHAGEWKWSNDHTLVFFPEADWPAGQKYTVSLDAKQLPHEAKLPNKQWDFNTPALQIKISEAEFNIDPRDPTLQRVVVGFQSSHPLDAKLFESSIGLEVLGGAKVFDWKGQPPDALFQVVEGKNQREFWVRSSRIQIPTKEDFVRVTLRKSITSTVGGQPLGADVGEKVRVPDAASGFFIEAATTEILRTEEGEPEQFLFVNTRGYAATDELQKHLAVWQEPEDFEITDAAGQKKAPAPNDVSEEMLRKFAPISLKAVELELSDDSPATTRHAFKFLTEKSGRLLVRITGGVTAMGGFVLAKDYRDFVASPTFPQEVQLQGKGGVLALNGERKLSLQSRGVPFLRVSMGRVPARQVNHLVVMTEGDFASPSFTLPGDFDETNIARFLRRVQPVAMKNEYQACYSTVDFTPALQTQDTSDADNSRGLFFLTAEGVEPVEDSKKRMEGDDVEEDWNALEEAVTKRFVLVTDLGLMVKKNADGSREVFVQSIQSGDPINGATVTVLAKNGEYLLQQTTVDGHAHFDNIEHLQREKRPVAIVASLGTDLSFLPFARPDRLLDFSRFETGGVLASEGEALEAFLFTERGVYRPGDEVHIGAVVKRRDWGGGLAGLPLEIEIYNSKDELVDNQSAALSADGFLEFTTQTNESDLTGRYTAQLYLLKKDGDEERTRLGRIGFRLEDFQPDRMKLAVTLTGNEAAGWLQPKDIVADASLETLFGFPAAKRLLKAKMELSPGNFAFSEYPDFIFHNRLPRPAGADESEEAGLKVDLGEQKTDDAGQAQFNLAMERFAASCFQVNLLVEGFEADGGRSVRAGKSFLIAALPYVIGYKTDTAMDYLGKDSEAQVKFMALDPALKPTVPPALTARVIQIKHVSVLTRQESGSYAYVSTAREAKVSEAKFVLPAEGAMYKIPTADTGEFRLELVNAESQVVCACPFTVVGKGETERSMERDAELGIKLARAQWQSGESLEASLNAPYTGAGLLTLERDRVLGWQWFKAGTTASVQHITVPEDLEGSAYVNASFVRALDSKEIFTSPLSYAVSHFTANPDKRKLVVEVDAPEKVKPGDVLKIGFKAGKACRVAIYAVDAGIHQITDYKLPNSLEHLNRKRAMEVETEQLMDLILPEFSLVTKHKAFGGDADKPLRLNMNPFKRRKEPPVVFWSGLVEAGSERREVSYTVPDYFAGKLNIMAVAVSEEAVGQAETSSIVRGPMVLTPNAPYFVAPGDEFTASLTVANNLEGADANAPITLSAQVTPHLEVIESPQGALAVAPGKEETVRFRLRVKSELGGAEITFHAEAAGQSVNRRTTLSVRPATPYLTNVQSGWFRSPTQDVKVVRQMYPEFRKLEATASALPLALTRGLASYLREYPHGCSEQITSRAVSRLLLAKEADFGFDPAESAEQLDIAFSLLRSRQDASGGFGYWDSSSGGGLDYLSVYVSRFLTEAKDAGYEVPADLLDDARGRLRQMARVKPKNLNEAAIEAAAIYLLTRNSENTSAFLLNLRDYLRAQDQDAVRGHLVSAYLAGSYALLQQKKEAVDLMQGYWSSVRKKAKQAPANWRGEYYLDPQVSQAEGFAIACRHFPELAANFGYEDLSVVTDPLTQNRFNTISSATTILALKAYSDLAKRSEVKVALSEMARSGGNRELVPATGDLLKADFSDQAGVLRFQLNQNGAADLGAFYQVTEAGFDMALATQRIADGLEVQRVILNGAGQPVDRLKVGESAIVELRVRNNSPEAQANIAVLDLMPGSFELEPNGLRPGRGTLPGADFVDVREDRNTFFCGLAKGELKTFVYRIKPIAAGAFVIPPAFAEAMYDRGIKGRDVSGKVVVE